LDNISGITPNVAALIHRMADIPELCMSCFDYGDCKQTDIVNKMTPQEYILFIQTLRALGIEYKQMM